MTDRMEGNVLSAVADGDGATTEPGVAESIAVRSVSSGEVPRVSVNMITYNHESFVGEAIEGIWAQDFRGPIEIHVGDDASTDNTRVALRALKDRAPKLVFVRNYSKNVGAKQNFLDGLRVCRGEYVALLDGDDYWFDPTKLSRQVQLLDENPELAFCFHAVEQRGPNRQLVREAYPVGRRRRYAYRDMADFVGIQTSSVVVRRAALAGFPDWFQSVDAPCGDWPLFAYATETGGVGYIDRLMSVHRMHGDNQWNAMRQDRSELLLANLEVVRLLESRAAPASKRYFRRAAARRYYDLAHEFARRGDRSARWKWFRRALGASRVYNPFVYRFEPMTTLMKFYTPGLEWKLRAMKGGRGPDPMDS